MNAEEKILTAKQIKKAFDRLKTPNEKMYFIFDNAQYFCTDKERKNMFILISEATKQIEGKNVTLTDFDIQQEQKDLLIVSLMMNGIMYRKDITI
jgi:hypothetical protein